MDITDLFQQILASHRLKQRTVCNILGLKSANQITRILKRQVSHKILINFGQQLIAHRHELNLTDGEVAWLQSCCLSMSLSTDDETAAAIFFSIMTQPPVAAENDDIALCDVSGKPIGSLKAFLGDALHVHASIVGCVHLPLCGLLQSLESHCDLNVDVYHAEGQRNHLSAQYLRSVWPFLHRPWFHPYCVRRKLDLY